METSRTMAKTGSGLRKAGLLRRTVCLHTLSQGAATRTEFYPTWSAHAEGGITSCFLSGAGTTHACCTTSSSPWAQLCTLALSPGKVFREEWPRPSHNCHAFTVMSRTSHYFSATSCSCGPPSFFLCLLQEEMKSRCPHSLGPTSPLDIGILLHTVSGSVQSHVG